MAILVLAEHDNASLKVSTRHAVTAAIQCGGEVHVLVAGYNSAEAVLQATEIAGVATVLAADAPQFADALAENIAAQVVSIAASGNYTHIIAPATAYGKTILPRVAALLDVAQISEITRVVSADTFERPIYAGNAIATVQSRDAIKVMTVRCISFAAAGSGGLTTVSQIDATPDQGISAFVSRTLTTSSRPELASARIVVSGGRGLGSAENFKLLEPLADRLRAAVGASRAAVDAGFAANDLQVGQTGKVVAPELYIAVGISGAIQHLAGMADSRIIVAINKDPEAPIFGMADYGIVGDLFEVVPELMQALQTPQ